MDHQNRIQGIVSRPPLANSEDLDYIRSYVLKEETLAGFFSKHAKSIKWLGFIEDENLFQPLFKQPEHVEVRTISKVIAGWFASNFVCKYPDEAFALIERQKGRVGSTLGDKIISQLEASQPFPSSEILMKWLTLLSPFHDSPDCSRMLTSILMKCEGEEYLCVALLVFEYFTKPHLTLVKEAFFGLLEDPKIHTNIYFFGSYIHFGRAWKRILKPNIHLFAEKLEPLLTYYLMQAHSLQECWGDADKGWDIHDVHRSAIEPHEQDSGGCQEVIDILIDTARDSIEWMIENSPHRVTAITDTWFNSGVPLLRRLAIHAVTENTRLSADQKIDWLIERNLWGDWQMKHEKFRLLEIAYPSASETVRQRFLDHIAASYEKVIKHYDDGNSEAKQCDYEYNNLIWWLHTAAPTCTLATKKINSLQAKYPDFNPSDYPDFDCYVVKPGSCSPVTVEALLQKKPTQENIEWLLTYEKTRKFGDDRREGLLYKLREAVSKSFDWSWSWVIVLQSQGDIWTSDIWKNFMLGWNWNSLTEEQYCQVFTFIGKYPQLYDGHCNDIADLLVGSLRKTKKESIPEFLERAEDLATLLWDICIKDPKRENERRDWLGLAISRPGGNLTLFLVQALSIRKTVAGNRWSGIPENCKTFLNKVIVGTSFSAELGRVILASQVHVLFAFDAKWCREKVIPLFEWKRNLRQAQQAWDGYLMWGQWSNILPEMLPLYQKTFSYINTEFANEYHDRFYEHLAGIALYGFNNPLENDWLFALLRAANADGRVDWAGYITQQLSVLQSDKVEGLWNRWLGKYWSERITGIPCKLSQGEVEKMISWVLYLKPVFPEVVEKICKSIESVDRIYKDSIEDSLLYHWLREERVAKDYPQDTIKLLLTILEKTEKPFYHCRELKDIVKTLEAADPPVSAQYKQDLSSIRDRLAELGCDMLS